MNMRGPQLRGLRGRGRRRRGTARRGMRSNLRTLAGSQIYKPNTPMDTRPGLNGRATLTEFKLRAGTVASGCHAGMGGGAESIDAKLVEVSADECEAGDSREPLGAAPDRSCGCTQVHKFTGSKSRLTPAWIEREGGRLSPHSSLGPRAAVAPVLAAARTARPVTAAPGKARRRTEPAGTRNACSQTKHTQTADGQADWIKGRGTITEFTFTAASGGRGADSMDAKLDEDSTEDNEAGERAAPSRICGFVLSEVAACCWRTLRCCFPACSLAANLCRRKPVTRRGIVEQSRRRKTTHTFRSLFSAMRPWLFKPNSPNIGNSYQDFDGFLA